MTMIRAICAGCGRWFIADPLRVKPEDPVAYARCDIGPVPLFTATLDGKPIDPATAILPAGTLIDITTKPGETS